MSRSARVTPFRTLRYACVGVCAALAVLNMATGCRASRRSKEPRIEPVERRVDYAPGLSLVLPVKVDGPIHPRRPLRVLLDDGRQVPSDLNWISVEPDGRSGWLPAAGHWTAVPASTDTRRPGPGSWCLVTAIPPDAIGQGVWIGRRRIALNWLADPPVPERARSAWLPPEGSDPGAIARYLAEERADPLRRWRARLLTGGLEAPAPLAPGSSVRDRPPEPDEFQTRALEALALQVESRWRVGLARLWRADPDLADRVKRRLVATVDFGRGVAAPAWPAGQEQLDSLLSDLLTPRLGDRERADGARVWLADQPPAAAWIIDDAGTRDGATGRAVVTAGLVNLLDRSTLGWAETAPKGASPDLVPVDPLSARHVVVVAPRRAEGAAPPPRSRPEGTAVGLHVGRWSIALRAATDPVPLRPPGFRLEPFFADWTLDAWLSGSFDSLAVLSGPGQRATSALVLREDTVSDQPPDAGWSLHVECMITEPAVPPREDAVRVWIGPYGRPRHILRVTSLGDATDVRGGTPGSGAEVLGVQVTRRADRWIARIPLPADAVESDGVIRLAVERIDSRGVRSSWPRPMLPWQPEPGRVALDPRAWGTVGDERPGMPTR